MGSKIQLLASVIQFAAYWYLTFRFGIAPAVKDARCPPEPRRSWEKPLTLTLSQRERGHSSRTDTAKVI
jgi:hypothetical protein